MDKQTDKTHRKKTDAGASGKNTKEKGGSRRLVHEFQPVYDKNSRILILGTFPSVKSREEAFYYGHPRNRFWPLIAALTGEETPSTAEEKKALLLRRRIALWDVISSCEITGSSDSSIRNVVPADLTRLLSETRIEKIYANGGTAKRLFDRYQKKITGREIIGLPSTSPANASWSMERLIEAWSCIIHRDGDLPASAAEDIPEPGKPARG